MDLRSMALWRVGVAFVCLCDLADRLFYFRALHSSDGPFPVALLMAADPGQFRWTWCIHALNGTMAFQMVMFLVHAATLVSFLVGYRTWVCNLLLYLFSVSLTTWNSLLLSNGDLLMCQLYFTMLWMPMSACYSVDAVLARHRPTRVGQPIVDGCYDPIHRPYQFWSLATQWYTFQLFMIYFMAALWKTAPTWHQGLAIYLVCNLGQMHTSLAPYFLGQEFLLRVMSFSAVYIEAVGPLMYLSPIGGDWLRLITVWLFVFMHLGFGSFLHIGIFPWLPMPAHLALMPGMVWDWIGRRINRPVARQNSVIVVASYTTPEQDLDRDTLVIGELTCVFQRLCLSPLTRLVSTDDIANEQRQAAAAAAARNGPAVLAEPIPKPTTRSSSGEGVRRRVVQGTPVQSQPGTPSQAWTTAPSAPQLGRPPGLFAQCGSQTRDLLLNTCAAEQLAAAQTNVCVAVWNPASDKITVYFGYDVFPELVALSPILWPLSPFLNLIKRVSSLGPKLYAVLCAISVDTATVFGFKSAIRKSQEQVNSVETPPKNRASSSWRKLKLSSLWRQYIRPFLLLFLTFLLFQSNLSTFVAPHMPWVHKFDWMNGVLRITQKWGMFSPGPASFTEWPMVIGTLRNGSEIDLFAGGDLHNREVHVLPDNYYAVRPPRLHVRYESHRWQRALMSLLTARKKTPVTQSYLNYACRRWNFEGLASDLKHELDIVTAKLAANPNDRSLAKRKADLETRALGSQLVRVVFTAARQLTVNPVSEGLSFVEAHQRSVEGPVSLFQISSYDCYGTDMAGGMGNVQAPGHVGAEHKPGNALPGGLTDTTVPQVPLIGGVEEAKEPAASDQTYMKNIHDLQTVACSATVELYVERFSEQVKAHDSDPSPQKKPQTLESSKQARVCDREYGVLVMPRGLHGTDNRTSVYLDASADIRGRPDGWTSLLKFTIGLLNVGQPSLSVSLAEGNVREFSRSTPNWGFASLAPVSSLLDPSMGFLVNDVLTVRITIHVIMDYRF